MDIHLQVDKNSGASLSWQIEKDIERQISSGLWAGQTKIPDERTLTAIYDVSRPTIRRAIARLCRRGLLVRRRGQGTFICDEKFSLQQTHVSHTIMLIVGDFDVFARSLRGIEQEALKRGYGVIVGERVHGSSKDRMYLKMAQERRAAGIIYEASHLLGPEDFQGVRTSGIPMVFIEKTGAVEEDFVGGDNRAGMALAVHHLHMLGHRRIGYVHHERSQDRPTQPERLQGFDEACQAHGIEVRPEWVAALTTVDGVGPHDEARVRAVLDLPAEERPTALCCYNDAGAAFVMKTAAARGLVIPQDLSIVGWDDTEMQTPHATPLTSLATAANEIGKEAARLLFEKIEGGESVEKRRIVLKPALKVRESTGPASPAKSETRDGRKRDLSIAS